MKKVAIIGASNDRKRFGNKAVRAFSQQGYTIYPVNPNEAEVEGLAAYKTVEETPGDLDIVSAYVAPPTLLKLLPGIAGKGCGELWLNPGTDSQEVITKAKDLKLKVRQTCSILEIGVSPSSL